MNFEAVLVEPVLGALDDIIGKVVAEVGMNPAQTDLFQKQEEVVRRGTNRYHCSDLGVVRIVLVLGGRSGEGRGTSGKRQSENIPPSGSGFRHVDNFISQRRQLNVGKWTFLIRALRSRNFRLFFAGQSVSLIGTWMTRVATGWLVYRLSGSAFLLGIVSFAGQVPAFFLAPLAGVLVDRWDRHRTLVVTQIISMLQSLTMGGLALAGVITIWHVVVLALVQGVVNAFDMPARQSFLIEMVDDREDLGNAIALNSSMVNAARLVGPALAGIVIAAVGEAYCFLLDGISYIGVIVSLLLMRLRLRRGRRASGAMLSQLKEGWSYVVESVPIRSILMLLALTSFAGMPYTVLMPVIASEVLHGGPNTLGILTAASGLGAFAGAVTLALRRTVVGLGMRIVVCSGLLGIALIAFGLSRNVWLSLVILPVIGFSMMQQMAASNTILQMIVDDEKRGRVMAFYSMAFQGMAPFGSLMAGSFAERIGITETLLFSGVVCISGAAWFGRKLPEIRRLVRPIYVRLGILPEAALGVQQASELQAQDGS
jgi:MFS family permease